MHRMPGLDLLRALAIVSVLCTHAWVAGGMGDGFDWIVNYGWMGVDLFFVLSGYLIGSQLLLRLRRGEVIDIIGFYRRRAYRILPAYLAVLALYFCIPGFREKSAIQPAWQFLTFTTNLLIEPGVRYAFSQAWSLCVEEHFYLIFPLIVMVVVPIANFRRVAAIMITLVLAGIAWRAYAWHEAAVAGAMNPSRYMQLIYYPTYARLDGLLCGVGLAMISIYRPGVWERIQRHPNVLALIGAAVIAAAIWVCQDLFSFTACVTVFPLLAVGFTLIVASGTSSASVLGMVRWSGVSWIAASSYSLYLIHKAIFNLVYTHLPDQLAHRGIFTFLCCVAGAMAAAAMLHHFIELPFLRLRDARRKVQISLSDGVAISGD